MKNDWRTHWRDKTQPRHRRDDKEFYLLHARELQVLTGSCKDQRVLDLGCGNGALYGPMDFSTAARFKGVDFSPSMLATFREAYPEVDLEEGDASEFIVNEKFDLIFSSAMVQNLSDQQFDRMIFHIKRMLAPSGRAVIASCPFSWRRLEYWSGVSQGYNFRWKSALASILRSMRGRDPMGRWFSLPQLLSSAERAGLKAEFFGCLCYPYRIHILLQHKGDNS